MSTNAAANLPAQAGQAKPPTFGEELKSRSSQFLAALPKHIPQERFMRVVMTAVQLNLTLLDCNRKSLWTSALKAANDGLLPDGKEGALVPYKGQVQWLPMIAGLRKKVRNSKELSDWNAQVVHAKDDFEYELGDDPFIRHKPYTGEGDPGPVIAAYSVATFRGTSDKSREVMTRSQLDKVRAVSKTSRSDSPWNVWFEEMCRKTVARRHSKILPMSTDLDDLLRRDDSLYDLEGASDKVTAGGGKLSMASRLDAIAAMPDPERDEDEADPETGEIQERAKVIEQKPATAGKKAQTKPAQEAAKPADEPAAQGDSNEPETDPRKILLAELQEKVADGHKVIKLLNGLKPHDRALISDEDVKALKKAEAAFAASEGGGE